MVDDDAVNHFCALWPKHNMSFVSERGRNREREPAKQAYQNIDVTAMDCVSSSSCWRAASGVCICDFGK